MSQDYLRFAERLVATGLITDPWLEGRPRFTQEPVLLSTADLAALYDAAERVAAAYDEALRLCQREPALLDQCLRLSPAQKLMWQAAAPQWHGVARADVFQTMDGGLQVCELNSDTPTGEPEALVLGRLLTEDDPGAVDPNAGLGERFGRLLRFLLRRAPADGAAGLVYPTEMTEDMPVVALYRRWLAESGRAVVLGSPFNLTATEDGGVALLGTPCALLLRHYKTDWWGERAPVWADAEPFPDEAPLTGPLSAVLRAGAEGRLQVLNPFGAVVSQNKRVMALLWERLDDLSPEAQEAVRRFVPYTARLETLDRDALRAERAAWVLKSDYGCEGDEVIIGRLASPAEWEEALDQALPERFVAQRYFAAASAADGAAVNLGVFLIAGRAAGVYARVQRGPTSPEALSAPVRVVGDGAGVTA